ncbi:MAG: hypothetical protein AAFU49_07385 [Pseudomonadota bacterium]
MSAHLEAYRERGWVRLPVCPDTAAWVQAAAPLAAEIAEDPAAKDAWLRCGGTWFAGVNIFPNAEDGSVAERGVPPLAGSAVQFIADTLGLAPDRWDKAQISVCYPGYPQPWEGESDAAFRFRRDRDAAHVDGLLRDEARRRRPGEHHGFILGLPLRHSAPEAAPMVVWEGSHEIMRAAFRARLGGIPPARWAEEDVTEIYTETRRRIFETCPRVVVHAGPGEAYVVHRLALHGVAPWQAPKGPPRAVTYFRPEPPAHLPEDWWLEGP